MCFPYHKKRHELTKYTPRNLVTAKLPNFEPQNTVKMVFFQKKFLFIMKKVKVDNVILKGF